MSAEIVLARHGETEWSRTHRHTGRTEVPLTEEGRRDGERLGAALRGREFGTVLCSPLGRARETCELAGFAGRGEIRDELREWDYGEYEGLTTAEIREKRPGWTVWNGGCPGGETVDEVARRVDPVVADLRKADADVILFAHGHLLRILSARWLEAPGDFGAHLVFATGRYGVLGHERETPALTGWNLPT